MMRLFLLLFPCFCFSQSVIDSDKFFALGQQNILQSPNLNTSSSLSIPWINEYQFRTETRDVDFDRQEYSVRLSPTTPKIRKTQKAYYNELLNEPDVDKLTTIGEINYGLHLDWLELYLHTESLQALESLEIILQDKRTIYSKSAMAGTLNPESLLKLQTEMNDLSLEKNEFQFIIDDIKNKYAFQSDSFDFNNFITIDEISRVLDLNTLSPSTTSTSNLESSYKQNLLTKELDIELAKKNQYFDFLQLKYTGPHTDLWRERVSLGLGFMLNTSGANKLKIQKLRLEKESLDRKIYWETQEKNSKINEITNKLKRDIKAYTMFLNTLEEEKKELKVLTDNVARNEMISPQFLLDIENRNINMKMKTIDRKRDILKDYLEYLNELEVFNTTTTVNYLTKE